MKLHLWYTSKSYPQIMKEEEVVGAMLLQELFILLTFAG